MSSKNHTIEKKTNHQMRTGQKNWNVEDVSDTLKLKVQNELVLLF